jgi:hypothetical protein
MSTPGRSGLVFDEALIFERSRPGRPGVPIEAAEVPRVDPRDVLGAEHIRDDIEGFPELSELDVVRHFTRLSQWNYGIDSGFYPLGSCTMKYNPKLNEVAAQLPGLVDVHPLAPESAVQGTLALAHELEMALAEIAGLDRVTLQPAAGAQGELVGMMMIQAYHRARGDSQRMRVLIPDTIPRTARIRRARPSTGWRSSRSRADRTGSFTPSCSIRCWTRKAPRSCSPTPTPWGSSNPMSSNYLSGFTPQAAWYISTVRT